MEIIINVLGIIAFIAVLIVFIGALVLRVDREHGASRQRQEKSFPQEAPQEDDAEDKTAA